MAKSLYQAANEFYGSATQHKRGQSLLTTARRYSGEFEFVFNFDVKDGELLHFIYKEGQLLVKEGRGEAGPGRLIIDAEITAGDLREILEGRLGATDAHVQRKLFTKFGATRGYNLRPYFCLWGAITRVGQDIVVADKVRSVDSVR